MCIVREAYGANVRGARSSAGVCGTISRFAFGAPHAEACVWILLFNSNNFLEEIGYAQQQPHHIAWAGQQEPTAIIKTDCVYVNHAFLCCTKSGVDDAAVVTEG